MVFLVFRGFFILKVLASDTSMRRKYLRMSGWSYWIVWKNELFTPMSRLSPDFPRDYPRCSKLACAFVRADSQWHAHALTVARARTHSGTRVASLCSTRDLGIGTISVLSQADAELFKKMSWLCCTVHRALLFVQSVKWHSWAYKETLSIISPLT